MATSALLENPQPVPRWHLSPALAAVWPRDEAWPIPGWLADGRARIVKKGPQRTVVRVDLRGLSFYLKQHHLPDWTTWLRQCVRAPKAKREFDRLVELARRGVPAPVPLGWGVRSAWGGVGESFVITRTIDDIVPLNRMIVENCFSPAERIALAEALGRFLAKLHDAGVDHRDLHNGNIVVRTTATGAFDLHLVDLDAVGLGRPLGRASSITNLSLFAGSWTLCTNRADRLRFLRVYAGERAWIDPARDLLGERELFDLARSIERNAHTHNLAFWSRRDERCLAVNRYYRKIDDGPVVGMALRAADDDWLAEFTRDPDAALRQPGALILKHSKTSTVAEIAARIDGSSRPAILKKIGATNWSDPLAAFLRPTPVLRSWIAGQGFLERNLPTPRPLAMLHRRRHGLLYEGYLVTEKLEGVQGLDEYVAELPTVAASERRRSLLRQIDRVARAVRDMHRRHVSHRDLKAANLLVTALALEDTPAGAARPIWLSAFPVAKTNLWFIDLVGASCHDRLGKRRRIQNLMRLNASFRNSPLLSRTDRLRFLRIYLAWGIHGKGDWKAWWRGIARATAAKVERNQKSGRVLG